MQLTSSSGVAKTWKHGSTIKAIIHAVQTLAAEADADVIQFFRAVCVEITSFGSAPVQLLRPSADLRLR